MVSRVLLVKFTNIREGLTEKEIVNDMGEAKGGVLEVNMNVAEYVNRRFVSETSTPFEQIDVGRMF